MTSFHTFIVHGILEKGTKPSMKPDQVYEQILMELAAGQMTVLQRKIFDALRKAYPVARTRRYLILDCFGYLPSENQDLNNNKDDRKIRTAIARLFDRSIPVVSSSHEAGYRLDLSVTTLRKMIGELRSRQEKLKDKERSAEKIIVRIHQLGQDAIPGQLPAEQPEPNQLSFIG